MIKIGLTGPSGAGKSFVCRIFEEYGIACFDTDKSAREVTKKGSLCLEELVLAFGQEILTDDGNLDRRKAAGIAFSDSEKHSLLNSITHKYIIAASMEWLKSQRDSGRKAAAIDAPLLIESGLNNDMDVVICVISPRDIRLERIKKRDCIDEEIIIKRFSRQHDDEFYKINSDYVIENDNGIEKLKKQVGEILSDILS